MLITFTSIAQSTTSENVRKSINIGSSKELIKYFDSQVEISLNGKISSCNKVQAEAVMRDFFNKNIVTSFQYIHHGESNNGELKYAIGNYITKEDSYRVLVRFKVKNNSDLIYNLKFTKE